MTTITIIATNRIQAHIGMPSLRCVSLFLIEDRTLGFFPVSILAFSSLRLLFKYFKIDEKLLVMSRSRETFDINQILNNNQTSSSTTLDAIFAEQANARANLMADVSTLPSGTSYYNRDYNGFTDFGNSQMMSNRAQEIIDTSRRFLEMLKEAESKRDVNLTDEETEHLRADAIASSLSGVHEFRANNSGSLINRKRGKRT